MKMHEKAMKRHTKHVETVVPEVSYHNVREDFPVHIVFHHNNDRTQRLIMSEREARQLVSNITACLMFKGKSVLDVNEEHFEEFQNRVKNLFTGV